MGCSRKLSQLPTTGEPAFLVGVENLGRGGAGTNVGLASITDTPSSGDLVGVIGSPDLIEQLVFNYFLLLSCTF